MSQKDKFCVINIRNYLDNNDSLLGENDLVQILSDFSCDKNQDVEKFLKNNSIDFTKKNQSVTYIILDKDDGELLGYFTIALKLLMVRGETISNNIKRQLKRISEYNEETQTFVVPAYLIAQLGKNYTNNANNKITGNELLEIAWTKVKEIQYQVGGVITFLEANNEEKLLSFYENNKFVEFDTRSTSSDNHESRKLVQLLRVL